MVLREISPHYWNIFQVLIHANLHIYKVWTSQHSNSVFNQKWSTYLMVSYTRNIFFSLPFLTSFLFLSFVSRPPLKGNVFPLSQEKMKAPEEKRQTKDSGPRGCPPAPPVGRMHTRLPSPPLVRASKDGSVILGVIESVDLYSRG